MWSTIGMRKINARPFRALQFAEPEDDAALVFAQDADGLRQNDDRQDDDGTIQLINRGNASINSMAVSSWKLSLNSNHPLFQNDRARSLLVESATAEAVAASLCEA